MGSSGVFRITIPHYSVSGNGIQRYNAIGIWRELRPLRMKGILRRRVFPGGGVASGHAACGGGAQTFGKGDRRVS